MADHEDVVLGTREETTTGNGGGSGGGGANGERGGSAGGGSANAGGGGASGSGLSEEPSAGRVRLVVQWLPVATADVVAAAVAAVTAAEAEAAKLKKEKKKMKKNDTASSAETVAAKQNELNKKSINGRGGGAAVAGGGGGALDLVEDDLESLNFSTSTGAGPTSLPSSDVVKALTFQYPLIASTSTPESDSGSLANLEVAAAAGNGSGSPPGIAPNANANVGVSGLSPRPPPTSALSKPGILAIRIAYTKLDYGDSPGNPILALSIGSNAASTMSSVAAAATAAALAPPERTVCMDCQAGGRPGLLHWGRVFHLPVWDPLASRALLELGDAASSFKLSTYGAELYALDAYANFDADVNVEAAASIPLKDVVTRGVIRGNWRLREARGRRGTTVAVAPGDEHEQLDVGRVALVMAWFPLA